MTREYLIESQDKFDRWFIVGSERDCTAEWARHIMGGYKRLYPNKCFRVTDSLSHEVLF